MGNDRARQFLPFDALKGFREALKEKERLVITLYYYEKLKFSEIGKVLEISESRVCQIHSQAVMKMKKFMKIKLNFLMLL